MTNLTNQELRASVGAEVDKQLKIAGKSMTDLASACGVSYATSTRLVSGVRDVAFKELVALSRLTGTPLLEIIANIVKDEADMPS